MCGFHIILMMESGKRKVVCTLPPDHLGEHYDDVFSVAWARELSV